MDNQIGKNQGEAVATLGIVAGAGRFPIMVADAARRAGVRVVVCGLSGLADPELSAHADVFRWGGVVRVGFWLRYFRRQGVQQMILAGSVKKTEMYGRLRWFRYLPDLTSIRLWFFHAKDKRTDSLLGALVDHVECKGITVAECVKYNEADMMPEGVLTAEQPSGAQWKDIEFGWTIAREMGRLDIGQSVAIREMEVVAVEAIEGTDRMIQRAGELCRRGGWALIKVAKPDQDMRFDVPTIGPDTVRNVKANGGRIIVAEAGKAFVVDREETLALAKELGIILVGHKP